MKRLILFFGTLFVIFNVHAQKKILFDNTKNEQAGNADWVIDGDSRYPTPAQSGISGNPLPNPTGDTDTYWSGALSMWGIEMVKQGFIVETLPSSGNITYGNGSNSQDLSNYDIFVLCEPNNPFSSSEKTAMMNFVSDGGGLFMIADHDIADRDGDGWSAVDALNDFMSGDPFGMLFNAADDYSDAHSTNVASLPSDDPILHGIAGDVGGLEFHGATSININTTKNSSVLAVIYKTGATNPGTSGIMCAYATYGSGRVVGLGDSSAAEDVTPNSGTTYNGWIQPIGGYEDKDDGTLITNATIWLAGTSSVEPEPTNNASSLYASSTTETSITLTWTDAVGGQLPSAYLIKAAESSSSIDNPIDGTPENDATLMKNVNYGTETIIFTGLTDGTTYDFKIYPYTNSGANIDYLVSSTPTAQGTTSSSSSTNIFSDDFQDTNMNGWITVSPNYTTNAYTWHVSSYYSEYYIGASCYDGTNNHATEQFVISPLFSTVGFDQLFIEFKNKKLYSPYQDLELYYSSDFAGDSASFQSATWTKVSGLTLDSNDGDQVWETSTNDISSAIGNANVYIAFKYVSTDTYGGVWYVDDVKIYGVSLIPEPKNNVTAFGVNVLTENSIKLIWTDAVGGQLPSGYLIKAVVNPASINNPIDGISESNGTFIKNVTYGTETVMFTELTEATTYDFKIFPYTNSGATIDYLVNSTPSVQGITTSASSVDNLLEYKVKLYPNPSKGIFKIEFEDINQVSSFKILDEVGKVIYNNAEPSKINDVDISHFGKGLYIISIKNMNTIYSTKIVLE